MKGKSQLCKNPKKSCPDRKQRARVRTSLVCLKLRKKGGLAEAHGRRSGVGCLERGEAGDHLKQSLQVFPDSVYRGLC